MRSTDQDRLSIGTLRIPSVNDRYRPGRRRFRSSDERLVSAQKRQALDHDALDLIEAEFLAPAIVELRRARRGVVRHRRGLFERAVVLQICRDSRRPETGLPSLVAMPAAAARRRIMA